MEASMTLTRPAAKLTHEAALQLVQAAAAAATKIGQPQVIVVVDEGGHPLTMLRMDGSRVLSIDSATAKARSAANSGMPTGGISAELEPRLVAATQGRLTNLRGGFPIIVDGMVVGGIGVGTGSPDQDVAVATAALEAVGLKA
jgi:glc operon protein GlcG